MAYAVPSLELAEGAPVVKADRPHLAFVDGLRAIAVLSVLAFHATVTARASFPNWEFCGARGVALFFVISGFCLSFPFLHAWRTRGTFALDMRGYSRFMLHRYSRIAPPYYVVLTAFAALALTPFGIPDAAGQHVTFDRAAVEYGKDLAFLTSGGPIFNTSFWTLGVEFRWYLFCPLLIWLYVRNRTVFAIAAVSMYVLYAMPSSIADEGTLPCFMAGILAADLVIEKKPWLRFAWILAAVSLAIAVIDQVDVAGGDLGNPCWHVACFFIVLAGSSGAFRRVLEWRPLATIGVASYSIYLVHGPFVRWFVSIGVSRPLAGAAALGLGLLAYYAIEKPLSTKAFRSALEARISMRARVTS